MVGIVVPQNLNRVRSPADVLQDIVSDDANVTANVANEIGHSNWREVYGQRLDTYGWPPALQYLYGQLRCWNNDSQLSGSDIPYPWFLMSLDRVDTIQKNYGECEEYAGCSVDFAYAYLGMGHVWVAAWCPDTQNIYYRHDGGSNGWEQSQSAEVACRFVPTEEQRLPLSDWFRILTNPREEDQFGRPLDAPFARPPKELEDRCWTIVKERNGITY